MAAISSWYNNQYSTWNRTRRLHATPYVARTDSNISRTGTALARNSTIHDGSVVINMGEMNDVSPKENTKQDSLFGPNIGIVSSGPAWAGSNEKKASTDQLTPEVLKNWIAKSKETNQPTTTLQALVNLKRPTLRLSPLALSPKDDPNHADSHHHHGLEFEYDCDAPKCGIYVHVLLANGHSNTDGTNQLDLTRVSVFQAVVPGGFGKFLKLEEGATLELGRFEYRSKIRGPTAEETAAPISAQDTTLIKSIPGHTVPPAGENRQDRKRRFTNFHFHRRSEDRAILGPALAVVDAEVGTETAPGSKDKGTKSETVDEGVKVTIQLLALDEEGNELSSPNEQTTYLHVVRYGAAPEEGEEDNRPWVVKVVKREATIGCHTFHLHEIYGLSSQSSAPSQPLPPTAPLTSSPVLRNSHSYPPTSPIPAAVREDEPSSECLLCLSSPREVVLLPCRHLVACKECAINMVEYGAGGSIVHADAETNTADVNTLVATDGAAATADTPGTEADSATAATPSVPAPSAPITTARRKRKAKGWFCPVCRQPYTSLLRITTTPPTEEKDGLGRASTSTDSADPFAPPTIPSPAITRGGLPSFRPGFLRGISRASARGLSSTAEFTPPAPTPVDLERGQA